jgi:cell division protein FtsL
MATIFLIVLAHITVTVSVMLLWLARTHLKLRKEVEALHTMVRKTGQEIASLASFEIAADSRLAIVDGQLRALSAKLSAVQQNEQSVNPYHVIIQKIRHGASVEELMRDCSLCRDEAVLLMRLHGSEAG